MPAETTTVSQIAIKINGSPLSDAIMNDLQEAVVDQSTSLPDMFTLRFRDEQVKYIDDNTFKPTNSVEIKAAGLPGQEMILLFKGEITAVEPEFRDGMLLDLVVRGYDVSHRMHREVKSRTFENQNDRDIASKIAGEYALSIQADATGTIYEHVYQHNQTDMAFLRERAWRIGFECFSDGEKLYFRKPPASGSEEVTLQWGESLRSFMPSLSLAEQVDEVIVRGWDDKQKKEIVGKASSGELYAKVGESNGASQASSLGAGKKVVVNLPVASQEEANKLAAARLNEISGAFVQATGVAFRVPALRAGTVVKVEKVGARFGGQYFVTSARHIYDNTGLNTEFEARGLRSGTVAEQMLHQEPVERWPGAVVATVTDNKDPEKLGRVKVQYPWLGDGANSWWAKVISPGAGIKRGLYMVPDVGDEVMVVFEQGDFNRPYILGGVWNKTDKAPPSGEGASDNDKAKIRTWTSTKGHEITVYDNADDKIHIKTNGGHSLTLDDKNKKIELLSAGGSKLVIDDQSKKVELESAGMLNVKSAQAMSIESNMTLNVKAKQVDLDGGPMVNIKGGMVKIN